MARIIPGMPRLPKPPGTRIPSNWRSFAGSLVVFEAFGFDPVNLRSQIVDESAMNQRFAQALVGVFEFHILADNADGHFVHRIVDAFDQSFPILHAAFGLRQMQHADDLIIETFGAEHERNFVNALDIFCGDDGAFRNVAEQGDLALHLGRQKPIRTAQQNVGLNSDFEQFFDAVLCRFGLQFTGGRNVRNQGEMNEQGCFRGRLPGASGGWLRETAAIRCRRRFRRFRRS